MRGLPYRRTYPCPFPVLTLPVPRCPAVFIPPVAPIQLFLIQVLAPAFWSAALVAFWLARAAWRLRRGRLERGGALRSYLHNRIIITVNCIIFVM